MLPTGAFQWAHGPSVPICLVLPLICPVSLYTRGWPSQLKDFVGKNWASSSMQTHHTCVKVKTSSVGLSPSQAARTLLPATWCRGWAPRDGSKGAAGEHEAGLPSMALRPPGWQDRLPFHTAFLIDALSLAGDRGKSRIMMRCRLWQKRGLHGAEQLDVAGMQNGLGPWCLLWRRG